MGLLKELDLSNDFKADRYVSFSENAFRVFIVLLVIIGVFKNKSISMHHGSLLYHSLMTMSMTFVPGTVRRLTKTYIIPEFRYFVLIFLFIVQVLGEMADFYEKVFWWDKMAHLISALILTIIGYIIVYMLTDHEDPQKKINIKFATLFAFSFSLMLGSLWEIFEYFMDNAFGLNMQRSGLVDTMEDMIVCVLSSLVICIIYVRDIKTGKHSFVTRTISKYIEKNKQLSK